MSFQTFGADAPGEEACQYGASRLQCRGPARQFDTPYMVAMGDSETFGKFVKYPFASLLEKSIGMPCVNLGSPNSGLDALLQDPDLIRIAKQADLAIIQAMGAQNLTNRFFRVHPRRNDRFLEPTPVLVELFPEVDFTDFAFTNHMMQSLQQVSPRRFSLISHELKQAWVSRMHLLLRQFARRPILLWLRYETVSGFGEATHNPFLVDEAMVAELKPHLRQVIEIPVQPASEAQEMNAMIFATAEQEAAANMIGQATHHRIAKELRRVLIPGAQRKRPA
ncbi:hypothetical protein GI582_13565 [Sulfitobacter sp. BDSS02]|nr:hypothetical protein [Sulfitobacter sp. BDSS02]MBR9850295.1 hypothetical protein [Paracoccaceae bacterium]